MFSKFNKQIDTIFLDSNSKKFDITENVNVILSPSLYWVKKVSLPVKYLRDAKALLPSLFEDVLPKGNFSYFAYKKGEDFFIFAYEDKLILDTLKEKGISSTQFKNIYFAQRELSNIQNPLKLDGKLSIYSKDDVLVLLPSGWMEAEEDINVSNLTLSKNYVVLNQFGHVAYKKSIYMLMSIFALLSVFLSIEYFIVEHKRAKTMELKDELFKNNALKATMIENRALLKQYTKIHDKQMKFRKYCGNILSTRLTKEQKISYIEIKNKKLIVRFIGVVRGQESALKNILKSKGLRFTSDFKQSFWEVEMNL